MRQAEALAKPDAQAAKSPGGDGKGKANERLNSQQPDVSGPGEGTPLQAALVDWINARGTLQLNVLEIERSIATLEREYQRLAGDSAVSAAVSGLGGIRLGPAKDYRRQPRLAAAREVFTARQPVYRECGRWRLGAVLNDQTPATFSFVEQSRPTFLSATLAESLGLEADLREPAERQRIGEREFVVRRATLPSLRLGGLVFRDVPVLLLPPEAEDLGSQLASGSLSGCRVRLEPNQMSLELKRTGS